MLPKPGRLRSMLIVFGLYFLFQGRLSMLKQAEFYTFTIRGAFWTLLLLGGLLFWNYFRQRRSGSGFLPEASHELPYLMHPQRQWLVLLCMPLLIFVEEFLFRVGLLNAFMPRLGVGPAILCSALVFVLAHEQALKADQTNASLFLYGLTFGLAYVLSDYQIGAPFLVHLGVNLQAWLINTARWRRAGYPVWPQPFNVRQLWSAVRL